MRSLPRYPDQREDRENFAKNFAQKNLKSAISRLSLITE
jgi:hypothetical protein